MRTVSTTLHGIGRNKSVVRNNLEHRFGKDTNILRIHSPYATDQIGICGPTDSFVRCVHKRGPSNER